MCTVSYLPQESGFVFTSNRDEHFSRSKTVFPFDQMIGEQTVFFPQDPLAFGTWIAVSKNSLVCLLNGGFTKHKHEPPYRKSRGIIVLERFDFDSFDSFVETIDLSQIEPFTMISLSWDKPTHLNLQELIWDGERKHLSQKNSKEKEIWSSSTLYNDKIRQERTNIFHNLSPANASEALEFHLSGGEELGEENKFKMCRSNGVKTISTSQIIKDKNRLTVDYYNHEENSKTKITLKQYI